VNRQEETQKMSDKCPVCNTDMQKPETALVNERMLESFSCRRCGDFTLDKGVLHPGTLRDGILKDDILKRAALSHWIRTRHESKKKHPADDQGWQVPTFLDRPLVESIIKTQHPSPMDQADSLVRWTGDNSRVGEVKTVDKYRIEAIVGSADPTEFGLVFGYLKDQGTITGELRYGGTGATRPADIEVGLSFPGWECYQELKRATSDSLNAFMAMQYDNKTLTDIFENVFKDAVDKTGFKLLRLVDTPQPAGLIDDDLRVKIRAARFLVADLTDGNAGAYWEAGYAEGLGKPVIYTCEKGVFEDPKSCPHFDTNHHLTILWQSDPDKRCEAGEKLKATVRATLPAEAKLTDD